MINRQMVLLELDVELGILFESDSTPSVSNYVLLLDAKGEIYLGIRSSWGCVLSGYDPKFDWKKEPQMFNLYD